LQQILGGREYEFYSNGELQFGDVVGVVVEMDRCRIGIEGWKGIVRVKMEIGRGMQEAEGFILD